MYLLDTDILSNLMKLTVVTGNVRHFRRVPGLSVEN